MNARFAILSLCVCLAAPAVTLAAGKIEGGGRPISSNSFAGVRGPNEGIPANTFNGGISSPREGIIGVGPGISANDFAGGIKSPHEGIQANDFAGVKGPNEGVPANTFNGGISSPHEGIIGVGPGINANDFGGGIRP